MKNLFGLGLILTGLSLAGCNDNDDNNVKNVNFAATPELFNVALATFHNESVFADASVQDMISTNTYAQKDGVLSLLISVISGPDFTGSSTHYNFTKTTALITADTVTKTGQKYSFLTDTAATSFTVVPYNAENNKTSAKTTFNYEVKPLSGLLLSNFLDSSFASSAAQKVKLKKLLDSGKTFPTGSEALSLKSTVYNEDMVSFIADDVAPYATVAAWKGAYPLDSSFTDYTFSGLTATCQDDAGHTPKDQDCVGLYAGKVYYVTVNLKGQYNIGQHHITTSLYYFNPIATKALSAGLLAEYK